MFAIANTLSNFSTKAKISSNSNYSSGASIGVDSISDQEKETEEELSGVEGVDGRLHYTIKHSLELLFRNKLYLPLHPFKTIIYNLLRDEASLGKNYSNNYCFDSFVISIDKFFVVGIT